MGAWIASDNGQANFNTTDTTNFHVITCTFTTTRREIWQDGLTQANETTTVGTNGNIDWFYLGTDTARFGNVDYGEVISFVGTDTTDRQKSEGYLGHKWGITLDSGHPYFGSPP